MSQRLRTVVDQAARFGLVGAMNLAINAITYSILVYIGVHYILASAAGTILGVLNSFAWSKFFVFKARGSILPQFARTVIVYSIQILVSWTGLIILIEIFMFNPYMAYAINMVVVTLISFLGLKYFAFRTDHSTGETHQ